MGVHKVSLKGSRSEGKAKLRYAGQAMPHEHNQLFWVSPEGVLVADVLHDVHLRSGTALRQCRSHATAHGKVAKESGAEACKAGESHACRGIFAGSSATSPGCLC